MVKGCLKSYMVDKENKTHILQFALQIGGLLIIMPYIMKPHPRCILIP